MPHLQRILSKYPPKYYIHEDIKKDSREIIVDDRNVGLYTLRRSQNSTYQEKAIVDKYYVNFIGNNSGIQKNISIIKMRSTNDDTITNDGICRIELYRLLKDNNFGKYFAFSDTLWGVCANFRGWCEFSLQSDDRFVYEIHAYELKEPYAEDQDIKIIRYIGCFFFASDEKYSSFESENSGEIKPHKKDRLIREAIIRPPQFMMKYPYYLVRLFPLSLNYSLEAFNGISYVYPGKEGKCIHASIYITSLLCSQWCIPITPIETTFYLTQIVQEKFTNFERCYENFKALLLANGLSKEINELDNIHSYLKKDIYSYKSNKPQKDIAVSRQEISKLIDIYVIKLLPKPDSILSNDLEKCKEEYLAKLHEVLNLCIEFNDNPKRGNNDRWINVKGISLHAAQQIISKSKESAAHGILEKVTHNKFFETFKNLYLPYDIYCFLFSHIILCYLREQIPVIVPVNHSKLHNGHWIIDREDQYNLDHTITLIGYREKNVSNYEQNPISLLSIINKAKNLSLIIMDTSEIGLYREYPLNQVIEAAVPYDPVRNYNFLTGSAGLPQNIDLLVCMPQTFEISFMDVLRCLIADDHFINEIKSMISFNNRKEDPLDLFHILEYFLRYLPILCHKNRLFNYIEKSFKLSDHEWFFLKDELPKHTEYSESEYLWVQHTLSSDLNDFRLNFLPTQISIKKSDAISNDRMHIRFME